MLEALALAKADGASSLARGGRLRAPTASAAYGGRVWLWGKARCARLHGHMGQTRDYGRQTGPPSGQLA